MYHDLKESVLSLGLLLSEIFKRLSLTSVRSISRQKVIFL